MSQPAFLPITRSIMRQKYRLLADRAQSVPRPDDAAQATVAAPTGHRVLVVGNEYAISWGVLTNALGLPGQLARELSRRTGLGADVQVISDAGLSITDVVAAIHGEQLAAYDAVIVVTGAGDAYQLLPPVKWIIQLKCLLETLRDSTRAATPIMLVGIQPGSSVRILKAKPDGAVDRWAEALNEISEGFCARQERVHYLAPPDAEAGDIDDTDRIRFKSPAVHKAWAVEITRHLLPLLPEPASPDAPTAAQDGPGRVSALQQLGLAELQPDSRFLPPVRRALNLFQTRGAAFTIVTETELVNKAVLGFQGLVVPAGESFCATTITTSGAFVVEDAWNDSRITFDTPIRFYAGHPVVAPDGTRIGAICVFDTEPRKETTIDVNFLRELAEDISTDLQQLCRAEVTDQHTAWGHALAQ